MASKGLIARVLIGAVFALLPDATSGTGVPSSFRRSPVASSHIRIPGLSEP